MNEELEENDYSRIPDGIEECEDTCKCGAKLRLHAYTFGKSKKSKFKSLKTRFYIDCANHCGRVSEWHDSPDEAIAAFDAEYAS